MIGLNFIIAAAVIILLIYAAKSWWFYRGLNKYEVDGFTIYVVNRFDNDREAAALFARAINDVMYLLAELRREYDIDGSRNDVNRELVEYKIIDHLLDNFNYEVLFENDPARRNETAYTLNKGDKMMVCLRSKSNQNQLIDLNTLKFVMLHEAAHIAHYFGWGHNNDFWRVFKFILMKAVKYGVYTPVDYASHPVDYCGLNVNHQPLYDSSIIVPSTA